MECYVYTYFYNKYGLKSLVIENMIALVNGVKLFKDDIHEVNLFA